MLLMLASMPVLCSTDYLTREIWFCTSAGLVQDIMVVTFPVVGCLPGRMGKYMVEMMGPSVWERFMMWQGKVEDMLKEVWDRVGVMMKCGVL